MFADLCGYIQTLKRLLFLVAWDRVGWAVSTPEQFVGFPGFVLRRSFSSFDFIGQLPSETPLFQISRGFGEPRPVSGFIRTGQ